MKQKQLLSSLSLNRLQLSVFLGLLPEEQLKKQSVFLDLKLRFPTPPSACYSDALEDTYCYDRLIAHLKKQLADRKFLLIEYLTQELYTLIKAYFPQDIVLSVRLTKQPPIPDLSQGVSFEYGDEVSACLS